MTRDQEIQFIKDAVQHAVKASRVEQQKVLKANKLGRVDAASTPAQPTALTCRNQGAQGLAGIKGTPDGPITRATKAALQNDRVSRVEQATPASGSAIRDDGPAARTVADTASTLRRLTIDADVAEATGGLTISRKTRPPTRDEIEATTQKNARGAESIVGVMRAQRLIREGKL
jgi:hypothetical protein